MTVVHGYTITPKQLNAAEAALAVGLDHEAVVGALTMAGMPERWGGVALPHEAATRLAAAWKRRNTPVEIIEDWESEVVR